MSINVVCNSQVDYSQVMGTRILPFVFTLNEEDSVLHPGPGQNQVFCYDVEGVGQDNAQFADLSHFLLGICSEITLADIAKVTVVVNGVEKEVKLGENVEIKTPEHPDNPTGCVGLKFDFPLNKVNGKMQVCLFLKKTFAVGPVNVCVFGGNVTATGKTICGPSCGEEESCDSVFFQQETVCVPVTVTPFANPGMATVVCCGDPEINMRDACPGDKKECRFTVTQRLCIEIPISFGAAVKTGDAVVQCGDVTREPCECLKDDMEETQTAAPNAQSNMPMDVDMNDRRFFYRK